MKVDERSLKPIFQAWQVAFYRVHQGDVELRPKVVPSQFPSLTPQFALSLPVSPKNPPRESLGKLMPP